MGAALTEGVEPASAGRGDANSAPILVVGAAIVSGDRVLACRRAIPADLAGCWEFPGGKVEPGESRDAALVREIAEELGCVVRLVGWLDRAEPIRPGLVLQIAVAELVDGTPRIEPQEMSAGQPAVHDALAWLSPGDLPGLDWLEADRPFVAELVRRLEARP